MIVYRTMEDMTWGPDVALQIQQLLTVLGENARIDTHTVVSMTSSMSVHVICALDDDRIIGFGVLNLTHWFRGTDAYIDEVVVDPEYREQGIGRAIIEQLTAIGRIHAKRIKSICGVHQEQAARLYEHAGYNDHRARLFVV